MQQILIYDDDMNHSTELKQMLEQCGETHIDIAESYDAAIRMMRMRIYDILFLDIELDAENNGITFAERFQKQFPVCSFVYITAHIKYCEEIFSTEPAALLLKPFTLEKVRRTLHFLSQKKDSDVALTLTYERQHISIPLNHVSYFESLRRRLTVYNSNGVCIGEYYGIRIDTIELKLPEHFLRCHQSILVNMHCIKQFRRYALTLHNGIELPVSQGRYQEAKQRYLTWLGGTL